jgi:hypothetical protein
LPRAANSNTLGHTGITWGTRWAVDFRAQPLPILIRSNFLVLNTFLRWFRDHLRKRPPCAGALLSLLCWAPFVDVLPLHLVFFKFFSKRHAFKKTIQILLWI